MIKTNTHKKNNNKKTKDVMHDARRVFMKKKIGLSFIHGSIK